MKLKIYQIDIDRDNDQVKFRDTFALQDKYGCVYVNPAIYIPVFAGELSADNLEKVFAICNDDVRPEGFTGHSLSISDIVVVEESNTVELGCYFCDMWGFKKVEFDVTKAPKKALHFE